MTGQIVEGTNKQTLVRIEITEIPVTAIVSCGQMGFMPHYTGDVPGAIAVLFSIPRGKVLTKGIVPNKHVSVRGFRPLIYLDSIYKKKMVCDLTENLFEDKDVISQIIFSTLEYRYKFKISKVTDSIDVWVLKVTDTTKLNKYVSQRGGGDCGIYNKQTKSMLTTNFDFDNCLCMLTESHSQKIIYNETGDIRRYDFELENFWETINDPELFNSVIDKFGLHFFKEKRLENLVIIDFPK